MRPPGGLYRPNAGCTLAPAAPVCPAGAQLDFEEPGVFPLTVASPNTLSAADLTCTRAFCGTGSLSVTAQFRWPDQPHGSDDWVRIGRLDHDFSGPVELYGKTLSFSVFIEERVPTVREGSSTVFNAQIAAVDTTGHWNIVFDGALPSSANGWSTVLGSVAASNSQLELPAGTTSLKATKLIFLVYLGLSPTGGTWEGRLFVDNVRWF